MNLDGKILVKLTADDLDKIEDLRELEQDFGNGVKALWSDGEQSILAFVFSAGAWTQAEAEAWVAQAKHVQAGEDDTMPYSKISEINPALKGITPKITLAQANEIAGMADAMENAENPWAFAIASFKRRYEVKDGQWVKKEAKDATSFDAIRTLVDNALNAKYNPAPDGEGARSLWVSDLNETTAVYRRDNKFYSVPYTVTEGKAQLGDEETEVAPQQGWKTADGTPYVLHAFESHLEDGTAAGADDDGIVWKEVIKPGRWYKMDSGRSIQVTKEIINEAVRAFNAGLPKFVSVPADSHHAETRGVVPAESNRGFVRKIKQIGDSVFGGFKLTDPQIAAGVQDGSIADCSVYLQPDVVHPQTGEKYPWVLRHVLLTNTPLVQDLRGFGDIPASGESEETLTVIRYRQTPGEVTMPDAVQKLETSGAGDLLANADEVRLTGDAMREYAEISALGLTAEELKSLAKQRTAIEAQAIELRDKAREMEVTRVVLALEGKDVHPKVKAIAGTRHYPVLINAVETALRNAPKDLALDAGMDGVSALDTLILDIVNAVPEDARIKATEAVDGGEAKGTQKPQGDAVSNEAVDDFINRVG